MFFKNSYYNNCELTIKKQSFKNNFLQEFIKNNLDKLLKINNK